MSTQITVTGDSVINNYDTSENSLFPIIDSLPGSVTLQGNFGNDSMNTVYIAPNNNLYGDTLFAQEIQSGVLVPLTINGGTLTGSGSNTTIIGGTLIGRSTIWGSGNPGTIFGSGSIDISEGNYTIIGDGASLTVDNFNASSISGSLSNFSAVGGNYYNVQILNSSINGSSIIGGSVSGGVLTGETEVLTQSSSNNEDTSSINTTSNTIEITAVDLNFEKSGNGSYISALKRMEIAYGNISIKFAINPSDYSQKEPNRATITQTKGGAWIDAWGAGIVEFNVKGITGVNGRQYSRNIDVGYNRWKQLRDLFRTVYNAVEDGQEVTELIRFLNYTDNEYWYCYPTQQGIELLRSKSKPHVYQYNFSLWGLRRIGDPTESTGKIGNPYKEEETIQEVDKTSESSAEEETTSTQDPTAIETGTIDSTSGKIDEDPTLIESGDNLDSQIKKYKNRYDRLNGKDDSYAIIVGDIILDELNRASWNTNSTTSTETTASVSSGLTYLTSTPALNTQADVSITVAVKTKSNEALRNESESHLQNLSNLIGGTEDGRIVPATGYHVVEDLDITEQGMVVNVLPIKNTQLVKNKEVLSERLLDKLCQEAYFANMVSTNSYELYEQIQNYDPTVLSPNYVASIGSTPKEKVQQAINANKYFYSTIYRLLTNYRNKFYISKIDARYIKIILLESMYVFREIYSIVNSSGRIITTLNNTNMNVLIRNIETIILYLEFNSTEDNIFFIRNLMWELRQLQYIMIQILSDIVYYL